MMPSSIVTSLFCLDIFQVPGFQASVAGADATATTYALNCPDDLCDTYNLSLTLGPWASKTLPPNAASTGGFGLYIGDFLDPWTYDIRCDMTRSVPKACTTTNIGGNDDDHPTATMTDPEDLSMYGFNKFTYVPVTITAGQDLLTATHAATTSDASDNTQPTSGSTTATGSISTPTPVKASSAASRVSHIFASMSVAGIAISILLL